MASQAMSSLRSTHAQTSPRREDNPCLATTPNSSQCASLDHPNPCFEAHISEPISSKPPPQQSPHLRHHPKTFPSPKRQISNQKRSPSRISPDRLLHRPVRPASATNFPRRRWLQSRTNAQLRKGEAAMSNSQDSQQTTATTARENLNQRSDLSVLLGVASPPSNRVSSKAAIARLLEYLVPS